MDLLYYNVPSYKLYDKSTVNRSSGIRAIVIMVRIPSQFTALSEPRFFFEFWIYTQCPPYLNSQRHEYGWINCVPACTVSEIQRLRPKFHYLDLLQICFTSCCTACCTPNLQQMEANGMWDLKAKNRNLIGPLSVRPKAKFYWSLIANSGSTLPRHCGNQSHIMQRHGRTDRQTDAKKTGRDDNAQSTCTQINKKLNYW